MKYACGNEAMVGDIIVMPATTFKYVVLKTPTDFDKNRIYLKRISYPEGAISYKDYAEYYTLFSRET